jgi:amidohydrolase
MIHHILSPYVLKELIDIRRDLHQWPDLSGDEQETSNKLIQFFSKRTHVTILTDIGGAGFAVIYEGKENGPTVVFRAELDALPIQETNHFEHTSQRPNISHKCGHDGHMVILLGLACLLDQTQLKKGTVVLLFQPAEETGEGARQVIANKMFKSLRPDYIFALHNLPGHPAHHIILKKGSFTASVKSIIITLHGKTSHAAEPEHGINPALAIAEIVQNSLALSNEDTTRPDFVVVTPVHINMGEIAYGVSAGHGELHMTVRTWTEAYMTDLTNAINNIVEQVSKTRHLHSKIKWIQEFSACQNDDRAVDIISESAHDVGAFVTFRDQPFKWGEDFGLFTQHFKGAIFGLGAGVDVPALHNPDYDFPDEIIRTGAQLFYQIIMNINKS